MATMTDLATQIAVLLNARNQLTVLYESNKVLKDLGEYLFAMDKLDPNLLLACARLKRVQWYQAELRHLAVRADAVRSGVGRALVNEALDAAQRMNVSVVQCTIRLDNDPAMQLFEKCGFVVTSIFTNPDSGRNVGVLQYPLPNGPRAVDL